MSAGNYPLDRMEPGISESYDVTAASMAISLKRIADAMSELVEQSKFNGENICDKLTWISQGAGMHR